MDTQPVLIKLFDTGMEITVSGSPAAVAALLERLQPGRAGGRTLAALTAQEAAIAALVGQGCTNQQIARRLAISRHTVNFHLRQIFLKLAIRSRVNLAVLAHADHEGHDGDRRD
ncbi:helix-turn-helix domain-containing protein [Paractinoplanes toevensis]|uniref:HTH luxR-type domain-containing protein n=1 Tax=Paractinoplanes toevensis TaxID=571911 RepID=A0A919THM1_9ACTN|nr:hypothetical protein Ato02nite_073050 [Actinoplanes toevensis]